MRFTAEQNYYLQETIMTRRMDARKPVSLLDKNVLT